MNPTPPGRQKTEEHQPLASRPAAAQPDQFKSGHLPPVEDLFFYYQPIFGLDRKPLIYEALVRWLGPDGVVHPPASFLDNLLSGEDSSMPEFTSHTIETAAQVLFAFEQIPFISINLSPAQICRNETIAHLESLNDRLRRRLIIEVTEQVITEREQYCLWLGETAALGIDLILDDVMPEDLENRLLPRLPVAGIKLDRSLLGTFVGHEPDRALLQTVTALRRLKLSVTVEGIEHPGQFSQLAKLGFDRFQGYGLGMPLPAVHQLGMFNAELAAAAGYPAGSRPAHQQ